MTERAKHIWTIIGVSLVTAVLLTALIWGRQQIPASTPCAGIVYDFKDGNQRMYVEEDELNRLLEKEHLYPVGKPISNVALQRMEQTIQGHPMVRHAECYLTSRKVVKVQLTQRVPLLFVRMGEETYYIDRDRTRMPVRPSITDSVLVVIGTPSEKLTDTELQQFAMHELADFANWLRNNKYWRPRVDHLDVRSKRMIYIHLKGEDMPRIVLGEITGYKKKLAKLHTYFEKGKEATQDTHYKELDLRFDKQVVGRK